MILLADSAIESRRAAVRGPLAPLFESLAAELEPLLGREMFVPSAKAQLTRVGGRCENDGTQLEFDPWSPHEHRCLTCGAVHTGEFHHGAWVTMYQLWLAERAVHGALFYLLRGDERHARVARDILASYAETYLRYANRDNVLGPTRLFFSTYLESVWLLQICVAADLMRAAGDSRTAEMVCDRVVEPSSVLIAGYDEGMSNRQVWHNAALLASARLSGRDEEFNRRIAGSSGLEAHLARALLQDGTWYEGENYHQFALRGLWYGVAMADAAGRALPPDLDARFQRAFRAPFVTALPDFTMPSRKDSQYAVSLRQWRFAELAELGFARRRDPLLGAALSRLYDGAGGHAGTGRARSTADIERNEPPCALTRADLGWRALLHASPELERFVRYRARSALLPDQGLAIFRRDDSVYVALDYGQSGGGHGHPDRLNLLLCDGDVRWLDDLGTGSYLDRTLHWYRSTLAHNAPLVDGRSQPPADGRLLSYDEREGLGWIEAAFDLGGVHFRRTVVVAPGYAVDELAWSADGSVRVELPWHLDAQVVHSTFQAATLDGGELPQDGFVFARDAASMRLEANQPLRLNGRSSGKRLIALFACDSDAVLFSARGPGQPALYERPFFVMRAAAERGAFRSVLAWSPDVTDVDLDGQRVTVNCGPAEQHVHQRTSGGWHVDFRTGDARSSVDLDGGAPSVARAGSLDAAPPPAASRTQARLPLTVQLGEPHYRRSEQSWSDAGSPTASVTIRAGHDVLVLDLIVRAGEPGFALADAVNDFDNEHADTMGAGVQLYWRTPDSAEGWMLVPEPENRRVRVRPIPGWGSSARPSAAWKPVGESGYELSIELPMPRRDAGASEFPLDLDLIVNETTLDRVRRRGQLVLSGARGEFVYLRGDRHDPDRLIPFQFIP